jgi:dienelactone hydrolase
VFIPNMDQTLLGLLVAMTSVQLHGTEIKIPDPLIKADGAKITSVKQWKRQRRPELLESFRTNVYGRAPVSRLKSLKFQTTEVVANAMDGLATRKQIVISYRGVGGEGRIPLLLFVPNKRKRSAPCFLLLNNRGPRNADASRNSKTAFWPAEEIVARGYAAAVINLSDIDPDKNDGFKDGVHGIFDNPQTQRPSDAWGTIGAWAWGASRVMDYLQTDKDIDNKRVAVVGHSRGGKTSLWAGAQDERFAMVVSNNSGSTGAALARGKVGENITAINKTFPHWFAQNYKRYDDKEDQLPVDQHQLLALIAPRPLYIASATEDTWADPEAEFAACVAASPTYQLYGLTGVATSTIPQPDSPTHQGKIGYHLRTGKHDLTLYDWQRFMDFADIQMKIKKNAS